MINSINSSIGQTMNRPSAAEMKQHKQEMFTQIDTNGDGSIDKAEFSEFGKMMAEKTGQPDKSEEMFAKMDTDGDGLISQAESDAFEPPPPPEGGKPPAMSGTQETSSDYLTSLLESLKNNDQDTSTLSAALQKYLGSYNVDLQSLINVEA
jgi:hypothetical protein